MKRTQTVPGFAFALAILVGASSYAEPTVTLAPGSTVSIAGTPTVNLSPGGTVTVSGMQFDSGGNLKVAATKTNTCAPVAGRIIPIVNSSEAPPLIVDALTRVQVAGPFDTSDCRSFIVLLTSAQPLTFQPDAFGVGLLLSDGVNSFLFFGTRIGTT